jgi:hypothetical protein
MSNRRFKQFQLSLESQIVSLFGEVTIGASGAIDSQSCKGFSVAKTDSETGRYTVTLQDKYKELKMCNVVSVGPADAALTDASGILASLRNVAVDSAATFDVQMSSNVDLADANPSSGIVLKFQIVLKNSGQTF